MKGKKSVSSEHLLTKRQLKVLCVLRRFIVDKGYSPTFRELRKALRIQSNNGVLCHLTALEKKGFITREPNKARTISLVTTD